MNTVRLLQLGAEMRHSLCVCVVVFGVGCCLNPIRFSDDYLKAKGNPVAVLEWAKQKRSVAQEIDAMNAIIWFMTGPDPVVDRAAFQCFIELVEWYELNYSTSRVLSCEDATQLLHFSYSAAMDLRYNYRQSLRNPGFSPSVYDPLLNSLIEKIEPPAVDVELHKAWAEQVRLSLTPT